MFGLDHFDTVNTLLQETGSKQDRKVPELILFILRWQLGPDPFECNPVLDGSKINVSVVPPVEQLDVLEFTADVTRRLLGLHLPLIEHVVEVEMLPPDGVRVVYKLVKDQIVVAELAGQDQIGLELLLRVLGLLVVADVVFELRLDVKLYVVLDALLRRLVADVDLLLHVFPLKLKQLAPQLSNLAAAEKPCHFL